MNKEQYYAKSNDKDLPLRCPILNNCERRALTIYLNSEYGKLNPRLSWIDCLKEYGEVSKDFEVNKISIQGEWPTMIGGSHNHFYCNNVCPEVNLFDNEHSLFRNVACVEGTFDIERRTPPKTEVVKTGHFSECPEFNMYAFEKRMVNHKTTNKKRSEKMSLARLNHFYKKK